MGIFSKAGKSDEPTAGADAAGAKKTRSRASTKTPGADLLSEAAASTQPAAAVDAPRVVPLEALVEQQQPPQEVQVAETTASTASAPADTPTAPTPAAPAVAESGAAAKPAATRPKAKATAKAKARTVPKAGKNLTEAERQHRRSIAKSQRKRNDHLLKNWAPSQRGAMINVHVKIGSIAVEGWFKRTYVRATRQLSRIHFAGPAAGFRSLSCLHEASSIQVLPVEEIHRTGELNGELVDARA